MEKQLDIFSGNPIKKTILGIFQSLQYTKGDLVRVLDEVKEIASCDMSYDNNTTLFKKVYELAEITEMNKDCHILNHFFCTLYQKDDDCINIDYRFIVGRIGNTRVYDIKLNK